MVPTVYKVRGLATPTRMYRRFEGKHTYRFKGSTVKFVSHDLRKLDLTQTAINQNKKKHNVRKCYVMFGTWASNTGDILEHQYTFNTSPNCNTASHRLRCIPLGTTEERKTEMTCGYTLRARNYRYDARGGLLRINKLGLYTVNLYKHAYVRVSKIPTYI